MVNRVKSGTVIGLNAYEVLVETDVVNSLPAMSIVGLPDTAVNEARDRVKSAIKNSGYTFPSKKVVINLAPADLKKAGTGFDLPIAIGILTEEEVLDWEKIKNVICALFIVKYTFPILNFSSWICVPYFIAYQCVIHAYLPVF